MQTFLPYADFAKSAEVLDNKRLGKQRVETLQIIKALTQPGYGWQNHPAVKMWRGHLLQLLDYQYAICREWTDARGYNDTCLDKSIDIVLSSDLRDALDSDPVWLGNAALHVSHRSNLVRKDANYYAPRFEHGLSGDMPYIWPVS